jgi:hypothetical protein
VGGLNPISLRVTDSAGKISTVSTTVEVVNSLTWDANGTNALLTDGAGDWTAANQWWNGTTSATWASGDDAIFGNGGAGGAVTLTSPTRVNTLAFNAFSGTYTLGSGDQTMTLKNGITKNASGTGVAAIISPITLGAAQSWTNHSAGALAIGPDPVNNGGFLITVGGTGNTSVSGSIEGAGGLTVPLTATFDYRDLAAALGLPVLVVASTRLGTINHTHQGLFDTIQIHNFMVTSRHRTGSLRIRCI